MFAPGNHVVLYLLWHLKHTGAKRQTLRGRQHPWFCVLMYYFFGNHLISTIKNTCLKKQLEDHYTAQKPIPGWKMNLSYTRWISEMATGTQPVAGTLLKPCFSTSN